VRADAADGEVLQVGCFEVAFDQNAHVNAARVIAIEGNDVAEVVAQALLVESCAACRCSRVLDREISGFASRMAVAVLFR